MLTARLAAALKAPPRGIGAAPVFPNPEDGAALGRPSPVVPARGGPRLSFWLTVTSATFPSSSSF